KSQEALEQIESKKYEIYLNKLGFDKIIKYGIAFCGKRCLVKKA
ncbi:MAG: PD-(D/E)XK nuclease domain-containing protein, partial [Oscillospiraceae bacterium]|nr:PD-(D/E)XK nuclease domain-containing protein [Oscillospiraceae bacterium]MBP0979910.1 PD-(D/E)XK nuclease domain-containing protein [Oscillospiraceae bacterium]